MSALGEMAGSIAHEINNPLGSILMLCSQLREVVDDDPLDPDLVKQMTKDIEKVTSRMVQIVLGLRSFSRNGAKDPFQRVSLDQLISETLSLCEERFKYHGVRLTIEPFDKSFDFDGRATEISQVLLNLLNNAHDAVVAFKEKWVRLSVRDDGEFIELRVLDSGPPIPEAVRQRMFQPFFTTKEVGKGTGMGLSISTAIVKNHGGELRLDPDSKNTCVIVRLPRREKLKG